MFVPFAWAKGQALGLPWYWFGHPVALLPPLVFLLWHWSDVPLLYRIHLVPHERFLPQFIFYIHRAPKHPRTHTPHSPLLDSRRSKDSHTTSGRCWAAHLRACCCHSQSTSSPTTAPRMPLPPFFFGLPAALTCNVLFSWSLRWRTPSDCASPINACKVRKRTPPHTHTYACAHAHTSPTNTSAHSPMHAASHAHTHATHTHTHKPTRSHTHPHAHTLVHTRIQPWRPRAHAGGLP